MFSLKRILPTAKAVLHIRAYLQKFRIFRIREIPVQESRQELSSTILSHLSASKRREKDPIIFLKKRQKFYLNSIFDAKFALSAFLIPSDEFILFCAFIIFTAGLLTWYLNNVSIENYLINYKINVDEINSPRIEIMEKKLSVLNQTKLVENETTILLYNKVYTFYFPRSIGGNSKEFYISFSRKLKKDILKRSADKIRTLGNVA